MKTKPVSDLLDQIYLESNNKQELDHYKMLSMLVMESMEARYKNGMTQGDLAKAMTTLQSVISRFENMGREPTIKFLNKMAKALNHSLGITLYGEFTATVEPNLHDRLRHTLNNENKVIKSYLTKLLNESVMDKILEMEAAEYSLTIAPSASTIIQNIEEKEDFSEFKGDFLMTMYCKESTPNYEVAHD